MQQQINNKVSQQQPLAQLSKEYRSLYFILKLITDVSGHAKHAPSAPVPTMFQIVATSATWLTTMERALDSAKTKRSYDDENEGNRHHNCEEDSELEGPSVMWIF